MTDDPRAVPVCDDEDLWALCSTMCDGTIDEPELARLERLLETDPASRQFCALYLRMNGQLMRVFRPIVREMEADGEWVAAQNAERFENEPTAADTRQPSPFLHSERSDFHVAPLPSPLFTYLSSGWPVAYLIATVIFAIGLLAGSLVHVSPPMQVVTPSSPFGTSNPRSPIPNPLPRASVARITGMLDCRWADSAQEAFNGAYVSLGRKYELLSGYMEITYDSGAKVVLQGPVTYEVESPAGGYLSVGRLTAKLEKQVGSGQWAVFSGQKSSSHSSNPQSLIPNHAFAVRTPTAIVTDLGTEFGVEVCDGGTSVHTFRGLVEVQPVQKGGGSDKRIRLGEKESVRISTAQDQATVKIIRDAVDPAAFVRAEQLPTLAREQGLKPLRRWQAYSEQLRKDPALVAYYTFEAPGQGGNVKILPNLSAAGSALNGQVEGAEWVLGRLPGKYALYFHGPDSGDKVVLPEQERFNFSGSFSIATWFRVSQFTVRHEGLVTKGNCTWRLQHNAETASLVFCTNSRLDHDDYYRTIHRALSDTDVGDHRWHLAVAICQPASSAAQIRLYVDGRLDADCVATMPLRHNDTPVWLGGNSEEGNLGFNGWIDEVAIFARALSPGDVIAMFNVGNPHKVAAPEAPGATALQPRSK